MAGSADERDHGDKLVVDLGTFSFDGKGPGTYVGGVFKRWADPERDLLVEAENFRKAADRCLNGCKAEDGIEMLTVPGAVCAALSCELFLKFVVLRESGDQVKGHRLDKLFQAWSDDARAAILSQRPDFLGVLTRNREHFVGARYHHELQQFSFRQQELLQAAELLSRFVQERFGSSSP